MTSYEEIEMTLNLLPEVAWDRFSGMYDSFCEVFGWVRREDGKSDFVLLQFDKGEVYGISTSSAKYSAEFSHRLGFDHSDCKRVEHSMPNVNCIHLQTKKITS